MRHDRQGQVGSVPNVANSMRSKPPRKPSEPSSMQAEQPREWQSPAESRNNDTNVVDDESTKSHRCGQCAQAFSRADHLKRHLLSHTGLKSYSCQFCRQRFSRSDRRQRHYERCALRGDGEIPSAAPKGRRRHACYNCISMKVQCDGSQPCSSCRKRGTRCVLQSHAPTTTSARFEDGSSPGLDPTQAETQTERISINTLLATGTGGFIKPCNFPTQEGQVANASGQDAMHTGTPSDGLNGFDDAYSHLTDIWLDEDLAFFDEAFTSVVNLPIPYQGFSFLDATTNAAATQMGYALPGNVTSPIALSSPRVEPPHIEALRGCLLSKLHEMNMREDRMGDITRDLIFFLAADGIERFIALYFENWHKNGPILHRPLFSPSAVRTSLLLAVILFGAMYSSDPQEHRIAAYLLDIAELIIFATPPFSCTAAIARKLSEPGTLPPEVDDAWDDFEDLQAAYLISTVQYWAGDQSGRNRVIENRFSDIVQVARKLGLTKVRHTLQDRISEDLWIRKERQVRTMYMIRLFDCAFIFYSNYPCILTFAELRTDLPCESSLFESEHPFSQEEFGFSRNTTAGDTLRVLFQASDPVAGARVVPTPMTASLLIEPAAGKSSPRLITLQDLYLLVHMICIMIQMRSALFSPVADVQELYIETAPEQRRDWNSLMERALGRWHTFWEMMRANTAPEQWEAAGMYKNSYNIWRVARLLHGKQEVVNSLRQLDVPCSDKLTELKVLLSGDE